MRKLNKHRGVAAPIIRNNIDTDSIIPSVEMKRVSKQGLSDGLFAGWRYTDRIARLPNPDFVLNQSAYAGTSILLSGKNFGCGSSREHAVWSLIEYGIRAIVAASFGTIFYTNCIANGLLPIRMPDDVITLLAGFVEQDPQINQLGINLGHRTVTLGTDHSFKFEIDKADAEMLLNGWDPISMTLRLEDTIEAFRQKDKKARPWVYL